jgi:hypothetical protein
MTRLYEREEESIINPTLYPGERRLLLGEWLYGVYGVLPQKAWLLLPIRLPALSVWIQEAIQDLKGEGNLGTWR